MPLLRVPAYAWPRIGVIPLAGCCRVSVRHRRTPTPVAEPLAPENAPSAAAGSRRRWPAVALWGSQIQGRPWIRAGRSKCGILECPGRNRDKNTHARRRRSLLFAALAADDAPAEPAVMPPSQQVEVFAARGARLCALVGLPFWPPVALRGRRYRALRPCMRALPPATFVGGATGRRRHGRWRSAWYGSGPRTAHLGISAADARYALASARQLSRRRPHVARAQLLLRLRQTARPFWVRLAAQTLQMAAGLHANMWAAPVLV